jgi:hypothetical protein
MLVEVISAGQVASCIVGGAAVAAAQPAPAGWEPPAFIAIPLTTVFE